ncbi:MAG: biopolymer transporter ExbD [Asticcacaulis sp.]|uniref:biopolymer transporter ExbD n=1 Tax=Asticcacaulis sp. TaxID=1872648 RepID=UPI0039E49DC3
MGAKLSGGGGSKFHVEANAEINVTPFVDVMLVLLIIFMVAAPLATVSVEVKLPPAVAKPIQNPPKPVYISLQKSGDVFVGNEPSSLDTLGDDLKKAIGARNPDEERIFIRCDKGTRYAEFMKVMNKLQDNGFYSVALQGEDDAK